MSCSAACWGFVLLANRGEWAGPGLRASPMRAPSIQLWLLASVASPFASRLAEGDPWLRLLLLAFDARWLDETAACTRASAANPCVIHCLSSFRSLGPAAQGAFVLNFGGQASHCCLRFSVSGVSLNRRHISFHSCGQSLVD